MLFLPSIIFLSGGRKPVPPKVVYLVVEMSKANFNNSSSNKCKRCKSTVTSGLKCVVCGTMSHKSCLNALKSVKFIDDATVNCCLDIVDAVTVGTQSLCQPVASQPVATNAKDSSIEEIRIKYLEEIIKQKDLVITNQAIAIKSLQDQLCMMRMMPSSFNQHNEAISTPDKNSKIGTYASALSKNKNSSKPLGKGKPSGPPNQISSAAVSHAIHVAQSSEICRDIIHLDQSDPAPVLPVSKAGPSSGPKKRSRNILVGDAKDLANCTSLKSANESARRHFHTTNWEPNTSEEVLLNYLKGFSQQVSVEKLNSRDPERYASFKVSVPMSDVSNITKPEIWPDGVRVNQFFRARNLVPAS